MVAGAEAVLAVVVGGRTGSSLHEQRTNRWPHHCYYQATAGVAEWFFVIRGSGGIVRGGGAELVLTGDGGVFAAKNGDVHCVDL